MNGGIKFTLDILKVMKRADGANDLAIFAMAEQALKDSNYYCKDDQDGLIDSSLINTDIPPDSVTHTPSEDILLAQAQGSDLHAGIIRWDMPYAKRQYYLDSASKSPNPNSSKMWFEKAKDIHNADRWIPTYKRAFKEGMK